MHTQVLSLLRLQRRGLNEVAAIEPSILAHLRKVSIQRRRELGEEIRAVDDTVSVGCACRRFRKRLSQRRLSVASSADAARAAREEQDEDEDEAGPARPMQRAGTVISLVLDRATHSAQIPVHSVHSAPLKPLHCVCYRCSIGWGPGASPPAAYAPAARAGGCWPPPHTHARSAQTPAHSVHSVHH